MALYFWVVMRAPPAFAVGATAIGSLVVFKHALPARSGAPGDSDSGSHGSGSCSFNEARAAAARPGLRRLGRGGGIYDS